ncbi:MAG: TlyA family RNA methyltransferase [Candidatus Bipolaricaulota bacterium]|nr:TlyA family RNA methyltransferase [Candidatus Bipolaricaulota bacterium]
MKERLDKVIKQRRLIRSRSRAQRMIAAGQVKVDGRVMTRPGHPIDSEAEIEILGIEILRIERYVSRGGEKLEAALEQFRVAPKGQVCLDIGASTGGFTDCLLQHGAKKVYTIDVGHDQMHAKIRRDTRVVAREGINARYLEPQDIGEPIDLVVVDVSFISLKLILPPLVDIIAPDGEIVALVKPQFEIGKERLPSDGVIKNATDREAVLADIRAFIESETPWRVIATMQCPIAGEKGNVEFLVHLR